MSTSNGEKATANTFNTSYVSREVDDNKVGKLDLENVDTDSQIDVQSNLNTLQSFTGATRNGSPTEKPTFTTNNIGNAGDNLNQRVDAIQAEVEVNQSNITTNSTEVTDLRTTTGTGTADTDMGVYAAGTNGYSITNAETTKTNIQELIEGVDSRVPRTDANVANGYAGLDANARILPAQLPTSATEYKGAWDASANTPSLADGTGTNGDLYRVSVAGTIDLGSGSETYGVGDAVIYNGSIWQKIPADDAVESVNGLSGIVVLDTDDIAEGSNNEYYTEAKVDAVIAGASIDELADVDTTTVAPTEGQALVYDSVAGDWVPGDAGSGSGAGSKTYFDDGDFENSIDIASVYDDGSSYVDGDGGSASAISIAATATALAGEQSLEITKAASDATGEGVTLLTETIDEIDLGKDLFFSLSYDFSDANYTTGDVQLKAYDVTNSEILAVVPIANLDDDGGIFRSSGKIQGKVIPNSDTDEIRLSLHVETDSQAGLSWVARLDECRIGPVCSTPTSVITDWQSYSSTVSWGTSEQEFFYRRVGDSMEIRGRMVFSSGISGTLSVTIPTGFNIDLDKVDPTSVSLQLVGNIYLQDASSQANRTGGHPRVNDSTTLIFQAEGGSTVTDTNPFTFVSGDRARFMATVPIEEWTSGNLVSTFETGFQNLFAKAYKSSNQTIPNNTDTTLELDTVEFDTAGVVDTVNDYMLIPKSGFYSAVGNIRFNSGVSVGRYTVRLRQNGNIIAESLFEGASEGVESGNVKTVFKAEKGDQITLSCSQETGSSIDIGAMGEVTYLILKSEPDLSVYGVFGNAQNIDASSSAFPLSTSGFAAAEWAQMTGNSIQLDPGLYLLFRSLFYNRSGDTVTNFRIRTADVNGTNSSTLPPYSGTDWQVSNASLIDQIYGASPGGELGFSDIDASPIFITVFRPTEIFTTFRAGNGSTFNAGTVTIHQLAVRYK